MSDEAKTPDLEQTFGPGSVGATAEERARSSTKTFVRSMDAIAEDSPEAKGRRLTAVEALQAYGFDTLRTVAAEGAALLAASRDSAGRAVRIRREMLGLDVKTLAREVGLPISDIDRAERSERMPIWVYERMARQLGMDERFVSVHDEPQGNERLAVRLRTVGEESVRMTHSTVAALAEAAWVAATQLRLEAQLDIRPQQVQLRPSNNYGAPGSPAYVQGYRLASKAREVLQLGTEPISSLRELCEERIGVPLVQTDLAPGIAGATIEVDTGEGTSFGRAIVVNLAGRNRTAVVRRSTIAHELGHVLFDPAPELRQLRVDDYQELDKAADSLADPVEQRANAFAVEFLAPRAALIDVFDQNAEDPLAVIMNTYGVSFTSARYQIWNGKHRAIPLDSLQTSGRIDQEWEIREAFTTEYHPLGQISPSRAGRFSAVVFRAAESGLISWDTAAEMLGLRPDRGSETLKGRAREIRDFFPRVFP